MGTPDQPSNALGKTLGLAWRLHRPEALPLIAKILPNLDAPELKQAAEDVLLQFNDAEAAVVLAGLVSDSRRPRAEERAALAARPQDRRRLEERPRATRRSSRRSSRP